MNTTKNTDKSETDDIEVITDEIARLRSDMSGLVEKLGRAGRSRAEGLAEEAKVKLGEQQARGEEMLHEIDADLRRLEDNILKSTRDNPVRALGIAAAVGFFLALIIRR